MSLVEDSKKLLGVVHFLRHDLDMSSDAATATAYKWQKQEESSQPAFASTFLHAAIENQIGTYRKGSFAKFNMDISVYPTDDAQPIKLNLPKLGMVVIGYQKYVFNPTHNSDPSKTMRVRLYQGNIQVCFCHSWRSITAYLDQVSKKLNYKLDGQFALDRQSSWWKANGKSFNMMALPGELRNAIFDQVFPSEARPFPTSRCRKLPPSATRSLPPSYAPLMRLNKQIYYEASARFYQTTPFLIEHRQLMSKTLKHQIVRERMRHLRFKLSHDEYLDLFGFNLLESPYSCIRRPLREINLVSLEVNISHPSQLSNRPWLEGACQRSTVGLILSAAWASIKGHPLTITGYVKDSQKKDLEARLRDEKAAFEKWSALRVATGGDAGTLKQWDEFVKEHEEQEHGGVRLDGKSWEEVERESSASPLVTSLNCTCRTLCVAKSWTAED